MPNLTFGAPENMYVRLGNDKANTVFAEQSIAFTQGGKATFDTFFNGMTIGAWKIHCDLNSLHLVLKGEGRFLIRFGLHRIGYASRWLEDQHIELHASDELPIALPFWNELESGMLYFQLIALGDSALTGGYFATSELPRNQVKLGMVITHFNRHKYVLGAIERIKTQLLSDSIYKDKIELIVVDNSKNLEIEEFAGITVLPNKNFGGSGGFTRGLLHLKDIGTFSHCLFMDDDASCEIESIKRVFALLQFAKTPKFAFAGSLLRELKPYQLFEKGAIFPGVCVGLKRGLDMRYVSNLLKAEQIDTNPDYGAWWFFAFALKDVSHYPFPFFVRGDDILFGMLNRFNIATLNGVGCWGEDFGLKNGPLPRYLDVRNHIVQGFVNFQLSRLKSAKLVTQFFISALLSYDYASAKSARLALSHVMKGPEFWVENIDMSKIRAEIAQFSASEKLVSIDRTNYAIHYMPSYDQKEEAKPTNEPKFRRFVRFLSLNGLLLPSALFVNAAVFQHKAFRGNFREIFRYKKVLYEYEPMGIGYLESTQ
jgi:hypothetical protein